MVLCAPYNALHLTLKAVLGQEGGNLSTVPIGQNSSSGSRTCIKVHLLAENCLLRELMAGWLIRQTGISVVGVTRDLKEAPEKISSSEPDILLTDCLTTEGGEGLLNGLYERFPQVRAVLFGMREDFHLFLRAVYLGAVGYLLADVSASEMIAAVREIAEGNIVCPPILLVSLFHHLARQSRAMPEFYQVQATNKPPLTYRQMELVNLVAKGMTNKEIAAKLNLSEFTVKNHIRRILKQVDAEDRQEAVNVIRATGYLGSA